MQETITYIIEFLLHGNKHLISEVGYTNDSREFKNYRVVIIPSRFFDDDFYGTPQSAPQLPLATLEGTPLLYGKPTVRKEGKTLIVDADIIASSYFLLSRYEETLHRTDCRDEHGRFLGKESLPYQADFITRPIVDEYGKILRGWLRESGCNIHEPEEKIHRIFLTHDVDFIAYFRHIRGFLGGVARSFLPGKFSIKAVIKSLFSLEQDPAYTFPWIISEDRKLPDAQIIFFVKAVKKGAKLDYPCYDLTSCDSKQFIKLANKNHCEIGLHASYASGDKLERVPQERKRLEKIVGTSITSNRHHYLRSLQPEDMEMLLTASITDDFTLGYPDVAGFRLGTCRAVKWINVATKKITPLTLHPLTVMDCTLSNPNYMNLNCEAALDYVTNLLIETKKHNGEVTLLWHNTIFDGNNNYHKTLYQEIIKLLAK